MLASLSLSNTWGKKDALGHQTHIYSDGRGRTLQVSAPDGPYIVYQYDDLDRLTEVDQVNRNTNAIFATTTLALDLAGRRTGMTDASCSIAWEYDAHGRIIHASWAMAPRKTIPIIPGRNRADA